MSGRGVDDVAEVAPADVSEFLMVLREGDQDHPALGSASAARTLVAVRGFHRFAVREGVTASDPARAVKPPAPPKRLPKALALGDVEALLEASSAAGTALAIRDRALMELLYGTGARISEAVGLDVDDLDLEEGVVRLSGKGGRERLVPVGSYARDACMRYLVTVRPGLVSARRGSHAVFLNARGGRLSRQSAWTVIAAAARARRHHRRRFAAYPPSLFRDPPARRGCRRPGGPGAARTRLRDHDADLYPCHSRQAA